MDESVFQQPTPEQLERFVKGDPLAMDEVIILLLPQLYRWGEKRYARFPKEDVHSAIHDVLNECYQNPSRYDPARSLITSYLIELIKKRMITVQQKQARRAVKEISLENSSENLSQEMYHSIEDDIVRQVDQQEFFSQARSQLTELEAAFFDLMRKGEIHQEKYAQVLARFGITTNVEREINNTKERVKYKMSNFARVRGLRLRDLL